MATKKQNKANKENAKKSSGPLTKEGKAISKRNAFKHGLLAKEIVINAGDGKEDYEKFVPEVENFIGSGRSFTIRNPKSELVN